MDIKIFTKQKHLPELLKKKVICFLQYHLPQGTVLMDASVYNDADYIVLLIEEDQIKGFSAQKLFEVDRLVIIQIMATFLCKDIRGKGFASLLMQGKIFQHAKMKYP